MTHKIYLINLLYYKKLKSIHITYNYRTKLKHKKNSFKYFKL